MAQIIQFNCELEYQEKIKSLKGKTSEGVAILIGNRWQPWVGICTLLSPRAISVHWASQYMRVSDLLGRDKVKSAESSYEITTASDLWPESRNWRRVLFRAKDIK